MPQDKNHEGQSGGVYIGGGHVTVGGDVVGRDKITTTDSLDLKEWAELAKYFAQIDKQIDARPDDPNVDKAELKETVGKIQAEVKKGQEANAAKVERWLHGLAAMADDIFQVTVTTLVNPVAGVGQAIRLIAQKARSEEGKSS